MNPPLTFTILGQKFTVSKFEHIIDTLDNNKALLGSIDNDAQTMMLATHQGDDQLAETYLHEMLHGIFQKAGLPTGNDEHEDVVNRVAPILLLAIRDNPRVLAFITGRWIGNKGSAR